MRDEIGERGIGARPASGRIDDQAYAMTALGLAAGDVEHVTEKTAERRPQDVQNLQRRRAWPWPYVRTHRCSGGTGGDGYLHRHGGPPVAHHANP